LFLVFGQAPIYGQLVGGATVKAGFGIDGDVYANLLQFGNLAGPSNTDDWFNSTYPGNGRGVIKQTDPIPATPNEAFSFRQSITALNSPYPYPLVPGVNDAGETVNYLWLDAVYGRDNYVKGGSAEKSYFAGSGDKNSDNPSTWSIGTSGSVPQKDDLIDVYAHLRGEGPRIPFTPPGNTDPRPFTTLWAYAGASLVVTNGNKHVDFEFFRTALDEAADLSVPGATGPDGGRTAWTFNPDGTVAIPGTIIVSVDYTNGGTSPQVRIRVWMDESVFNNFNNLPISGRPFTVDPGTFESGTGSTVNGITYGYGVILPNVGTTAIWGRVNDNDSTLGPPWGTFEGSTPDAVTHYQTLQFVEIGINLTAFGLDARGSQDPCSNILGSLLVKTRSSGGGPTDSTAFGSELKDFAGPFLFGNTGTPPVVTVTPKTTCSGLQVDLTQGSSTTPSGGVIRYYTDDDYEAADEILNPTTYIPSETMTIYARSESVTNPGCYGTASFIVTVNNQPDAGTDGNTTVCDSSTASIDLYSLISGEDAGGTWTRLTGTGGTFNAAAGTFVPTDATTSTFKYMLSATAPCVADESIATVNINPTPIALVLTGSTICVSDPGTGTVSSTTSELGVTYQLRIGTTPVQAPQPGTGSALTWINLDAGTNYNVVSTGPAPTNCPGSSNSVDVATEACGGALCTYTQGYYGNPGGLSCAPNDEDGFDKYTTLELIERALASYTGGIMTIGSLGNTVIITNTLTDREAIISVLPGGGSSYVLSGSYSISALPSSYLSKKGTINNTLLAQTITLGLNIGINGALSDFVLQGGVLVTAAAEGGCGSDIPKVRTCNYDINGNLTSVTNDYEYYSIDANVLAAIEGEKTVQGLFDLANKALGGGDTNGVSLTSIADVVDKINNAFDGCRLFIGYDVPKCPTTINTTEPIQRTIETASFDAYPVPFKDELTIKYKFDYVS
ncbi:MAG: hypothetical protein U0945_08760, partial [Flavobacterium sp.]|nr:hypothetical protein [Flavobacterium sp.]